MLANTSDFNPATDSVAPADLLEIDRYALARAAALQADILAHYEKYEFHPVVSKLQVYCSEDLGAFYLDILKDRLYTSAPNSLARRSAQTALYQITQAFVRWMAPFLSFTAEEAWGYMGQLAAAQGRAHSTSIFIEIYSAWPAPDEASAALLDKWQRIRELRDVINKEIEAVRTTGAVGSSLQAHVTLTVPGDDHALLTSLGDDLKFITITSSIDLVAGDALLVSVEAQKHHKCDRCWHYRDDVGHDPAHPTLCGRCTSNLYGNGETRRVA